MVIRGTVCGAGDLNPHMQGYLSNSWNPVLFCVFVDFFGSMAVIWGLGIPSDTYNLFLTHSSKTTPDGVQLHVRQKYVTCCTLSLAH